LVLALRGRGLAWFVHLGLLAVIWFCFATEKRPWALFL
jgi:hypothetical protein